MAEVYYIPGTAVFVVLYLPGTAVFVVQYLPGTGWADRRELLTSRAAASSEPLVVFNNMLRW